NLRAVRSSVLDERPSYPGRWARLGCGRADRARLRRYGYRAKRGRSRHPFRGETADSGSHGSNRWAGISPRGRNSLFSEVDTRERCRFKRVTKRGRSTLGESKNYFRESNFDSWIPKQIFT